MLPRRIRRIGILLTATLLAMAAPGATLPAAQAASYVELQGDGSSWAEPAITQWARDMVPNGISINYTGDGSATGRGHYIQYQNDFAGSDIAFLKQGDPFGGGIEDTPWNFSYIPIVAGGTSFLYNLTVGGQKVTNLRLSGQTIANIFTGGITNWNDPAITRDYGAQLPNQPITVVTRSDGSGASYMFTRWLAQQFPGQWNAFCRAHGGPGNCPPTEFYPGFGDSIQKNGSDQVAAFLASPISNGAIGYDEYAYALNYGLPVVKMLNQAKYYTLPTPSNVAIALQAAVIDENAGDVDFLMQNLDNVYTYNDPRAYPLSSYSYLIIPRDHGGGLNGQPPPTWNNSKGVTLSTWLNYVLCGAQQSAGNLGYSPLPKNLVVGAFQQVSHMPGAIATPDLAQLNGCNNPTYSNGVNHLIVDAPQPSPCDYYTAPLDCTVQNGHAVSNGGGGGSGGGAGGGAGGTGGGSAGNNPGAGAGTGSGGSTSPGAGAGKSTSGAYGSTGLGLSQAGSAVHGVPVMVSAASDQQLTVATLTVLELLAAVLAPVLLGAWLRERRKRR